MDKVIDKIIGLGVPGLILIFVMELTGFAGAAAITTALATLGGPFGMLGGIAALGIMVLIFQGITKYGFENIAEGVIFRMKSNGIPESEIYDRINSMPISKELKAKLIEAIRKMFSADKNGGNTDADPRPT